MVESGQIGLIVNPFAGQGVDANLSTASEVISRLSPANILTGSGQLGQAALEKWVGAVKVFDIDEKLDGRKQTQSLARQILKHQIDILVIVGGDGTMADVAQVLLMEGQAPSILGIGVGSTNVGRLITCNRQSVDFIKPDRLQLTELDCLLAYHNGDLAGVGFNDGVIGFTVVGTLDDEIRDLDAAALYEHRKIQGIPRSIATHTTKVSRIHADKEMLISEGNDVGTVVVGFAEPFYFGKAITGGVCFTALVDLPAGCIVSEQPLVQIELTADTLRSRGPVSSKYISLDEGMRIVVENVQTGAVLCADGNPLRLLLEKDRVEFGVQRAAITVVSLTNAERDMK